MGEVLMEWNSNYLRIIQNIDNVVRTGCVKSLESLEIKTRFFLFEFMVFIQHDLLTIQYT